MRPKSEAQLLASLCGVHGGAGGIDYREGVDTVDELEAVKEVEREIAWAEENHKEYFLIELDAARAVLARAMRPHD